MMHSLNVEVMKDEDDAYFHSQIQQSMAARDLKVGGTTGMGRKIGPELDPDLSDLAGAVHQTSR